jgi:hypothetical protein
LINMINFRLISSSTQPLHMYSTVHLLVCQIRYHIVLLLVLPVLGTDKIFGVNQVGQTTTGIVCGPGLHRKCSTVCGTGLRRKLGSVKVMWISIQAHVLSRDLEREREHSAQTLAYIVRTPIAKNENFTYPKRNN